MSNLALKSNWAKLKAEVDKIDNKLAANVNNIDMSGFVLGTKYDTDKSNLDKKISDADRKYLTLVDFLKQQIVILKSLR